MDSKPPGCLDVRYAVAVAVLGFLLAYASISTPVEAAGSSVVLTVGILDTRPNVTDIQCCFKDSDSSTWGDCGINHEYSMTGGESYDLMCNFTVFDGNGWQDMIDGWVNVTWHHSSVGWDSPPTLDTSYVNQSCRNVTGSEGGTDVVWECQIQRIRYWADAGEWNLVVNLSDGENIGNPGLGTVTLENVTSIWQSSAINFGAMQPGATGSQYQSGTVNVNATTNNTGNTALDLQVDGVASTVDCTIGSIPIGNVEYDVLKGRSMDLACGQLTSSGEWDVDCDNVALEDCSGTCPNTEKITYTYWGITIPGSGIGGVCSRTIIFSAVQAYP
ncbi:MAG: hypothetical protein GF414_10085 [Candidatus Altiarchaeales archaeon]|nr:hypothetical protein [Candidatus Altiarchaeales archaeon]